METFSLREYGRSELASLYSQTGYQNHQRTFTPRQVSLIVEALGEP